MIMLSKKQLDDKIRFIHSYMSNEKGSNNASKSEVDANSNVSTNNIATLAAEVNLYNMLLIINIVSYIIFFVLVIGNIWI